MDSLRLIFKNKIILFSVAAVIGLVSFLVWGGKVKPQYEFTTVSKTDIKQEVSATGKVIPARSVLLSFDIAGKVAGVYKSVGDAVRAGDFLVTLDNADVEAQVRQKKALLDAANASLDDLLRGTRAEEIQVEELKVKSAGAAIQEARLSAIDTLRDSYAKADDAIRNKVDQFMSNPRSDSPKLNFTVETSLANQIATKRSLVEQKLVLWSTSLGVLSDASDFSQFFTQAKEVLVSVNQFFDVVAYAVNGLKANASLSQTTIDGWRSDVSIGRTNVNTALSNISSAEEKLNKAIRDLDLAKQELAVKQAPATEENIAIQKAKIREAQAVLDSTEAALAKTILRSPISGVVTKQEAKTGESVSAHETVASVVSAGDFEIEVFIPEADVAKVSIGNTARVTLDAYGKDAVFLAHVTAVDPAETEIEGVSTYKTTLHFDARDERIKSGMTANIDILSASAEGVLAVPERAVLSNDEGTSFVRVVDSKAALGFREVPVKTGLRGSDGNMVIESGLSEGEKVIIFLNGN
ncbi:MAG: efflux RND transporter periplasmic adaptor subunit [Candidatus Lloydbacteria bacterium]|nr:efflux RND transporter periplasmic adaptor subunit [Candidatus Lloydbacteria bacterium]